MWKTYWKKIKVIKKLRGENQYYQIYYKPKAVEEIINWFNKNRKEAEYKIIYERNTKNGKREEVKEHGYKIENICYKVKDI